jgi:hypothetical protein
MDLASRWRSGRTEQAERMTKTMARLTAALAITVSLAAACGGSSSSRTATPASTSLAKSTAAVSSPIGAPPSPSSSAPGAATSTPSGRLTLPQTALTAPLATGYKVVAGQPAAPTADELPVASGSVQAQWYQSSGNYVVHYFGLSLNETSPLCLGNSILTAAGFQGMTNASTTANACIGVTNFATPPAGVRFCGTDVLYVTEIPVTSEGTLYGTLEKRNADGTVIGLTSTVQADHTKAPEIDLGSCSAP